MRLERRVWVGRRRVVRSGRRRRGGRGGSREGFGCCRAERDASSQSSADERHAGLRLHFRVNRKREREDESATRKITRFSRVASSVILRHTRVCSQSQHHVSIPRIAVYASRTCNDSPATNLDRHRPHRIAPRPTRNNDHQPHTRAGLQHPITVQGQRRCRAAERGRASEPSTRTVSLSSHFHGDRRPEGGDSSCSGRKCYRASGECFYPS